MRLASTLGLAHLELDRVFHQPGWAPLPDDEFRRAVSDFVSGERWVVDGNYSTVSDLVWDRADTVVWLDLSRRVVTGRIVRRTLGRLYRHEELWNGNHESWLNLIDPRPDRNVILWSLTRQSHYRRRYEGFRQDGNWSLLDVVRLRNPGQQAAFVESLS